MATSPARRRRRADSGSELRWKEPAGVALLWLGVVAAVFSGFVIAVGPTPPGRGVRPAILVLVGGIVSALGGGYLIHRGRFRPGWLYEPGNLAEAFQGLEQNDLVEVARALASAGEAEIDGVTRRATLGRFQRVLACIHGLCRQCSRTVPTQGFLLFRAIALPWFMGTIYVWEWLRTRLCRECAGHALRYFTGLADGGGGAALLAGLLWLPWNFPQYLWSRRLPGPEGESRLDPEAVRRLEPLGPGIVEDLRQGRAIADVVAAAARKAGTTPGHAALFLVAYGELCRRASPGWSLQRS